MHIFGLYNENNVLIHEYKNLKCNAGDNLKDNLNHIDLLYVKVNDDYSVIKIELILSILDDVTKQFHVNYITLIIKIFYVLNI